MAGKVADWADLTASSVTHAAAVSQGRYGSYEYGAGTSYAARISTRPRRLRRGDGQEVQLSAVVWLESSVNVKVEDRLTMPDGTTPPIVAVERVFDEVGAHHTKLYLG